MRTRIFRTFALGAVAGSGVLLAFSTPSAQAACLPNDPSSTCTTFDPATPSSLSGYDQFSGQFSPPVPPEANRYNQARVQFKFTGSWTSPFDITGISLTGDGITSTLSAANLTINTPTNDFDDNRTAWLTLDSNVSSLDFENSTLSFVIPGGVADAGATIESRIQYRSINTSQLNSSSGNFLSTARGTTVPGPLPILGSGVAFGLSRRLRRRIRLAA
jgi:hypothetical protein